MCSDAAAPAWVTGPRGAACPRCIVWERALANPGAYVYLLGLYLGDGYIAHHPRAQRLRITLDLRYPSIINDACEAIREISGRTANTAAQIGCTDANGYSQHWTCVFPQAGPGPKHLRLIVLEPWQVELVRREPESLIRGLIHSDGCRIVHTVAGHQYVRYFFSNMSHDIHVIFRDACDQLGIRWTASSHKHTSIARRDAVAALDRFVGPKH